MILTPADQCVGVFHFEPEIQPKHTGVIRMEKGVVVEEFSDPSVNPRVIVESQAMTMLHFLKQIGVTARRELVVCGGAAESTGMLQVFADVFGCKVCVSSERNAAGVGGIIRAMIGVGKQSTLIGTRRGDCVMPSTSTGIIREEFEGLINTKQ